MSRSPAKQPRRITLTLTAGEERAILGSNVYALTGTVTGALRFWLRKGIEDSQARDGAKASRIDEHEPDWNAIR